MTQIRNSLKSTCFTPKQFKAQFIGICQLCDKGNRFSFESKVCTIQSAKDNKVFFATNRNGNVYIMNFGELNKQNVKCFSIIQKDSRFIK